MRQPELHLTEEDRSVIDEIRCKGIHPSRAVNRAHVLSCLDRGARSPGSWLCPAWGLQPYDAPTLRICQAASIWRR
ncbi:MAG: hypothetical protein Q8L49_17240 [Burkholderiaceae bacterium]|nr:hypothetical protein [Burkholderiaceae bacterium]